VPPLSAAVQEPVIQSMMRRFKASTAALDPEMIEGGGGGDGSSEAAPATARGAGGATQWATH
jgi:hypothetical protein